MLRAAGRRWREAARAHQRRQLSGVADGPVAAELADRRVLRLAGDDLEHFLQARRTSALPNSDAQQLLSDITDASACAVRRRTSTPAPIFPLQGLMTNDARLLSQGSVRRAEP